MNSSLSNLDHERFRHWRHKSSERTIVHADEYSLCIRHTDLDNILLFRPNSAESKARIHLFPGYSFWKRRSVSTDTECSNGHCLVKERVVPGSVVHGVPETTQQDHRAEFN